MAFRKRKPILPLTAFLLLLFFVPIAFFVSNRPSQTEAAWYNTNWKYRKELTFNNAAQGTNLVNFPVLVVLDSTNFGFSQAQSTGADLRFTDSDGSTLLQYEIETYDQAGQNARVWVNVPQINASSSTDSIFLYWGNSDATDAQNADSTWNSNYKAVYHLSDNSASTAVLDSSGLNNTITASENTNNGFSQDGKIGKSLLTAGAHNFITNQSGNNISEMYPDIVIDANGYPVIAYYDANSLDLVLVHCNDRECKGSDESVNILDSAGTTGQYPSIQLDSNGYPMVAYYNASSGDLKYIHCNDANCSGGDESTVSIDTAGTVGQFPSLVLDSNGYPVISYYAPTGADLKLVHCGNANCTSGNVINIVDSAGTVGNGAKGNDIVLDSNGYPVISYYDTTNTELKIAHCNDPNCSGSDESITSPLISLGQSLGIYNSLALDASGFPMVVYRNSSNSHTEFIHCDDVNCAGDESTNKVIVSSGTADTHLSLRKNSSGVPVIVGSRYGAYPVVYACSNTNCSTNTFSYLSLYNQYGHYVNFKIDANNNLYVVTQSPGRTGDFDTLLFTTHRKLERAYDSDFNFGTGSFSVSAWFKSNGMVQKNQILSRYDNDQGFKIGLNYAGRACFEIDDDSSWGPDDFACSSNSQVSINVDNGNGTTVNFHDMVLDSNGYPVIAYFDDSTDDLELIHCNDPNCTGNDEFFASIDTVGDVGRTPSIVLDSNGYPVIAYHGNTNNTLKLVHCGNANCTSGNVINTVDPSTDNVGDFPSLKLDSNGYPVIAYYDTTNTAVKLARCNDANCSGGDESIVMLVNDADNRVQQGSESLQLDANGYPIVVYFDNTNGDLRLIHCNDANCSGNDETKTLVESANWVGTGASMVLDSNGYPVIAHFDYTFNNLRLMHCGNVDCNSGNVASAINLPSEAYFGLTEIDIRLNSSGHPVILSTQTGTWSTTLTVCNDPNCTGNDETHSMIRDETDARVYHSLALDSNNYPVISYAAGGWDLRLIHMTNPTTYTETGNYDDGQWHHLVAVKNGTSSITLYVDGVVVGTDTSLAATGTLTSDSATLNLAEEILNGFSVNNWSGYLDEIQIDTTARSADWVAAQYLSESNNFINVGSVQNGPAAVSLGSVATVSSALENNLVAHYKFDEGYGTIAHNSNNNGTNHGALTNTSWVNEGLIKKALRFNLTSSVDISGSTWNFIDDSTDFTISAWIKPSNVTGIKNIVGSKRSQGMTFFLNNAKITHDMDDSSLTTNASLSPNTWYHVAVTFKGSDGSHTSSIYINGNLDKSGTNYAHTIAASSEMYIGRESRFEDNFDGLIDEVKIYNAVLTAEEIKLDYNQGSAMSFGSLSDTSALAGGSIASSSATAVYCVPGSPDPCSPPVAEWSFEEGTGTVANDISGNGNSGTLTAGPSWTTGKTGKAISFVKESNQYISIANESNFDFSTEFSAEAWVNIASHDNWAGIVSKNVGNTSGWEIRTTNVQGTIQCRAMNGVDVGPSTAILLNTWQHVACTYSTSDNLIKLYVNGRLTNSVSGSSGIATNNNSVLIGGLASNPSWGLTGSIDDVRIFNYPRTPAQIAWDYNQGKPVAHWKLDECQGTVANDSSGNGNTGTITIGATGTNATAGTCTTSGAWFDGATGKFNSSLDFDGTDDYVQVPDKNLLDLPSAWSVGGWFKPSETVLTGSDRQILISKWQSSSGALINYSLEISTAGKAFARVSNGTSGTSVAGTTTLSPNSWYHFLATFNSVDGSLKIYVNGILENTTATGFTSSYSNTANIRLGQYDFAWATYRDEYKGLMDDVRIYNYPLTPTQIKMVHNEGSSIRFGP